VPQFPVWDGGVIIAWLDMAWPELKVWLEFDGAVKYRNPWRADEGAADVVLREKQREDLIRRITGWRCIRVTWADLFHPALLAEKIRRLFSDQATSARQAS
jgi:hypothetical protein